MPGFLDFLFGDDPFREDEAIILRARERAEMIRHQDAVAASLTGAVGRTLISSTYSPVSFTVVRTPPYQLDLFDDLAP